MTDPDNPAHDRDTAQALSDALIAHARATGCLDQEWIPTHWIVLGAAVGPGIDETAYWRIYSDDVLPNHISLGLLDVAITYERNNLLHDEDDL